MFDQTFLTIAVGAISTVLAAVSLYRSNQVKVRADEVKLRVDEVALLRTEVARLHRQQAEQEKQIDDLRSENALLYRVLRRLGVDVEAEIKAMRDGAK